MTQDHPGAPPSLDLLRRPGRTSPAAQIVVAEVRSQVTIPYHPEDAPGYLQMRVQGFGSMMLTRLDASWEHGKKIQDWLKAAPPAGMAEVNQEAALKAVFKSLETDDLPGNFVEYVGTYLVGDQARARFVMVLGFRTPITREQYRDAWARKLAGLQKVDPDWYAELIKFLRLYAGQATSTEEFLMLVTTTGDLADPKSHPVISHLIP